MDVKPVKLAIIGAGPAGMAAALAAVEAGVDEVLLVDRMDEPGGILQQCIHNGFGLRYFREELTGPEYARRFIEQIRSTPQIQLRKETMVIQLNKELVLTTVNPKEGMVSYKANAVILAMGCRERSRGAINLPGTRPAGIYTAGMVQRLMNIEGYRPGNKAVILGSGDIGLIMARRLTLEGIEVSAVLELMPYSNGLTRNILQCLEDYKIPLLLNHTVIEIRGNQRLESIVVCPVDKELKPVAGREFVLECDLLVLSVGLIPENELSTMAGVELDPFTSGPRINSCCQTNIPGIFACGNVAHVHDLVDDVSEESWLAGMAAAAYIHGYTQGVAATVPVIRGINVRSVVPQQVLTDRQTTLYIRPAFPGRDVVLCVGAQRQKLRIISPGETIRFQVGPKEFGDGLTELHICVKGSGS